MKCSRLAVLILASCLTPMASLSSDKKDDALSEQARKVHFSSIVLDTHIDVTPKLQTSWKFT